MVNGFTTTINGGLDMKSVIVFLLIIFPLVSKAQDKACTVSGRVSVDKRVGNVYVFLVTKETFEKPFSGIDTLIFPVNYDKTQVYFEFKNVPPGNYGLSCFQDVNGDEKMNRFIFGPREPWAFSYNNDMKFPPAFDDISFNVYSDIRVNLVLGR